MNKSLLPAVAALAIAIGLSTPAYSQSTMVDGQITKINELAETITIKHGPIRKFDMDGMTMDFRVQDPTMLKQLQVGDKIKFEADKINGQFTVMTLQKAE